MSMPQPVHITLGVLTFKRPQGISKLLDVMRRQVQDPARPWRLSIVVVDNDAEGSSRDAVMRFADCPEYELTYVVEPRQGIPIARNRAMDSAPEGTALFCFLDDDEWPVDGWLDAMLHTRAQSGADCIYGPIEPVFDIAVSGWLQKSRLFDRKKFREGQRLTFAASNNVMFDLNRVRSLGLRFDHTMRFTGGSDYLFFNQAVRRGVTVCWSDAALVYDIIPASRTSLR